MTKGDPHGKTDATSATDALAETGGVLILVPLIGCGDGSPTFPTESSRLASADLVAFGALSYGSSCVFSCIFSGEARNEGSGFAGCVTGTTRLHRANHSLITSHGWSLRSSLVVRPGNTFSYLECCFTNVDRNQVDHYHTDIFWTSTAC